MIKENDEMIKEIKSYWFHTQNVAEIKASKLSVHYSDIEIKKVKSKVYGDIYLVLYGRLKL